VDEDAELGRKYVEALMVTLFVPESEWGPKSWGVVIRATSDQIEHGPLGHSMAIGAFRRPHPAGDYRVRC
jgi:hypothetical protein